LKAEFVNSSGKPETFPADRLPEVAFLGRSNVGKSSLINALVSQKGLAFTSNTPGRTQTINFYRIFGHSGTGHSGTGHSGTGHSGTGHSGAGHGQGGHGAGGQGQGGYGVGGNGGAEPGGGFYFVDLPGYGYARVPPRVADEWKKLIEEYLQNRETLKLSCLILDSRRGWMDKDLDLKRWLEYHGRPYLVIATKTDKLNQSEQERGFRAIRKEGVEPMPFSALNGRGRREIWQAIAKTIQTR